VHGSKAAVETARELFESLLRLLRVRLLSRMAEYEARSLVPFSIDQPDRYRDVVDPNDDYPEEQDIEEYEAGFVDISATSGLSRHTCSCYCKTVLVAIAVAFLCTFLYHAACPTCGKHEASSSNSVTNNLQMNSGSDYIIDKVEISGSSGSSTNVDLSSQQATHNTDDDDDVNVDDGGTNQPSGNDSNDNFAASGLNGPSDSITKPADTISQQIEGVGDHAQRTNADIPVGSIFVGIATGSSDTPTIPTTESGNNLQTINIASINKQVTVYLSDRVQEQISNYREARGIILNLHITHHGGTTVCTKLGHAPNARLPAPYSSCNLNTNGINATIDGLNAAFNPWKRDETKYMIQAVLPVYHMIAWEFSNRKYPNKVLLSDTDWYDPGLLSIFVIREPMSRMMAGDGWVLREFPGISKRNATEQEWWNFARHSRNDNYALRIIAGAPCCSGEKTDRSFLELAKQVIGSFSFVLDIECLDQGLEAVAQLTGLELEKGRKKDHAHVPTKDLFYNDEIYDYARNVNKLDIELYEWAKQRALLNCSALRS
jgi:hypothetical protein